MTIRYFSLSDTEAGYTTEDLPQGATEITYDTYITIKAALEVAVQEFIDSLESS